MPIFYTHLYTRLYSPYLRIRIASGVLDATAHREHTLDSMAHDEHTMFQPLREANQRAFWANR